MPAPPDPFIRIRGLSKRFGEVAAVDDVSLDIGRGELFSILGPSGCGKTTLLRILAGFESPSAGRIEIDGVDVTRQPPYERPVNMMFQSYAVFPHMDVARNVGYGLRKEGLPASEIAERVQRVLQLVQLEPLGRRRPDQLSGGQLQRVALARALVKRPKVLLLDEPLAALDKKLREQTQFELTRIQEETGVTFVVVTHDQDEAMALSSRVAVMNGGRLLQVGEPKQVYEFPTSRFVADFVGTINTFEATVSRTADGTTWFDCRDAGTSLRALAPSELEVGRTACLAVRPEKVVLSRTEPTGDDVRIEGVVVDVGYLGNRSLYRVRLESGKIVQATAPNQQRSAEPEVESHDAVWVSWPARSTVVLED